ncbi:MAG: acyl-CoA dehydrogenase family protein, partial [Candidatus Acidiferrales bacterium]
MDLNLSPDELKFRDELRAWLEANVPREWDETREESLDRRFEFLRKWQRQLFDGGWAGISWAKEYGGRGASLMQQVIFWQEMAR